MKLLALLFIITSCANLSSIDKPVCTEITPDRGYCVTIISGKGEYVDDVKKMKTFDANGKLVEMTWFEMKPTMVLVPIQTYAALKKYLIMNCKKSKRCNDKIDSWDRSMEIIEVEIESKMPIKEDNL